MKLRRGDNDFTRVPPIYTGAGAPTSSTLRKRGYRIGDLYVDTTGLALYECTTAGDNSGSAWTISGVTPTIVVKTGSKSGTDYTASTSITTFQDMDGTNLAYTVTIPSGYKLLILVSATCWNANTGQSGAIGVYDSVANAVVYYSEMVPNGSYANAESPLAFSCEIDGDGASHTIKMQFTAQSTGGANVFTVSNPSSASALRFPGGTWAQMIFILTKSN